MISTKITLKLNKILDINEYLTKKVQKDKKYNDYVKKAIEKGEKSISEGRVRPIEYVLKEIEEEYGLMRR